VTIAATHVWIWRAAGIDKATAINRALRASPGAKGAFDAADVIRQQQRQLFRLFRMSRKIWRRC